MNQANVIYGRLTPAYHNPAWWALDRDGYVIGGPTTNLKDLQRGLAWVNRQVRNGNYTDRDLYTAY